MTDLNWRRRSYCWTHHVNPDIFEDPGNIETAKAICRRCPVTEQCLTQALSDKHAEGVWGGTTEAERIALNRGGQRVTCPGCLGTQIYSDGRNEICVKCGYTWRG